MSENVTHDLNNKKLAY